MSADSIKGKKIIVGVTGGIAAYKTCLLVRQLIRRGADVRVVMSPSALGFIAPLTFSTLTGNDVIVKNLPASQENGTDMKAWHIEYGLWADLMIIAPATVNTLAKIRMGMADNALTMVVSALRAPLLIAPAADVDMYHKPANIDNITVLEKRGAFIVHAESGFLASGLEGCGRMADPEKIVDSAELVLSNIDKDFKGKKILVTAGPTYEDIDPVRFIGNRSSGKMGIELAKAAFLRGAEVKLICGPSSEEIYQEIERIDVRSASEMQEAVNQELAESDILIMSAAVADYKPADPKDKKIKKEENLTSIELTENQDILANIKKENKVVVGFALETDFEFENAQKKLKKKNLDMIVLNSLKEKGAGFEFDTNKITILNKDGNKSDFPLQSKFQTANCILSELNKII